MNNNFIEDDVFSLLLNRDAAFLTRLFQSINPLLLRLCAVKNISNQDAQDIIHKTWEVFFRDIENFKRQSQIKTYVCGILLNKIKEWRRDHSKLVPEEDISNILDQTFTADGWWKTHPQDPYRLADTNETIRFVQECLKNLSEQQSTAFFMREIEEETPETICEVLGVELVHLRVLIFRAKDKLKKCIEAKMEGVVVF